MKLHYSFYFTIRKKKHTKFIDGVTVVSKIILNSILLSIKSNQNQLADEDGRFEDYGMPDTNDESTEENIFLNHQNNL